MDEWASLARLKADVKDFMQQLENTSQPATALDDWRSIADFEPNPGRLVMLYEGDAVLEHSHPPEWAFIVGRWPAVKSTAVAVTHWRYIEGPLCNPQ